MNKRILFPLCAAAVALTAGAQDYRQADQYLQQVAKGKAAATAAAPSHVSHHTILLSSKARAAAKKTDKLLKIQRFQRTSFLFFPFQKFSTNSDRISPKFCV